MNQRLRWQVTVGVLGVAQILAWGSTFYLLAVLAGPIARDTGWSYDSVIGGVSLGLAVAGLVSPRVGKEISRRGGDVVLTGGAVMIAAGLALLALSPSFLWYLGAWVIVGIGMGAGLYDAAFSTAGGIYGKDSRSAITAITLYGGFASTVCWPISALMVEQFGWRGACLGYAAMHAFLSLPLYVFALPRALPNSGTENAALPKLETHLLPEDRGIFFVLAAAVTIAAAILALIGTNLVQLLEAQGLTLSSSVALGMLIGPSAVGARLIESFAGKHYHPIWTMTASVTLVLIGALLLLSTFPLVGLAIVFYAAGNGIGSIARGTLPLALFGPSRYPVLMGRLALPLMIAMAAAPFAGAWAFQFGAQWTLRLFVALATANALLVLFLWRLVRTRRHDPY